MIGNVRKARHLSAAGKLLALLPVLAVVLVLVATFGHVGMASAAETDAPETVAETEVDTAADATAAKAAAPAVETEDENLVGDTAYPTNATATAVSIQDDVKVNGQFILKATIDGTEYTGAEAAARLAAAGYTVTWSKGNTTYNNGLQVKSGDTNVPAVEQNGGWINVAYTSGSKAEYTVTVSKDGAST